MQTLDNLDIQMQYHGKWDYEDFFFEELMPHVEKRFRIKRNKRFRAVAGLSMGGGGSFLYAFIDPTYFLQQHH